VYLADDVALEELSFYGVWFPGTQHIEPFVGVLIVLDGPLPCMTWLFFFFVGDKLFVCL
jgi:hypothetical protein